MAQQGRVTEWNDDRGFGFITPLGGESRVFVHIGEFPSGQRRPLWMDLVTYTVDRDDRDRPRAKEVRFVTATPPARPHRSTATDRQGLPAALLVSVLFLALMALLVVLGLAPALLLVAYVLLSAVLFLMYSADKEAAQRGDRRTPEKSLHILALAGGWPGALVAQRVYRHKTSKQPFQLIFWCTVIGNCGLLAWLVVSWPAAGAWG